MFFHNQIFICSSCIYRIDINKLIKKEWFIIHKDTEKYKNTYKIIYNIKKTFLQMIDVVVVNMEIPLL